MNRRPAIARRHDGNPAWIDAPERARQPAVPTVSFIEDNPRSPVMDRLIVAVGLILLLVVFASILWSVKQ